ncbi:MAG: hypothetical protein WCL20_07500 [Actinomycetes bacterium]
MLFDLRAKGRRRFVKAVYVFLAILIGGGLVFFGIGGSGTGLLDAGGSGNNSSGNSYDSQAVKAEKAAAKPGVTPAVASAQLSNATRLRFQAAGAGFDANSGAYTTDGQTQLKLAAADWQRYLATVKGQPDVSLAKLMAQAYAVGALTQPKQAVEAWQIVAAAEPGSAAYAQLAINAYLGNMNEIGDQAASRALEGLPPAQQTTLKGEFKQAKAQAKAAAAAAVKRAKQNTPSGFTPGG